MQTQRLSRHCSVYSKCVWMDAWWISRINGYAHGAQSVKTIAYSSSKLEDVAHCSPDGRGFCRIFITGSRVVNSHRDRPRGKGRESSAEGNSHGLLGSVPRGF